MSSNRLSYDLCSYKQVLGETTGPGFYQLNTPPVSCKPCHPTDPRVRLQSGGVALNQNTNLIDIDSELIGIGRNLTSCSSKKYLPNNINNSFGEEKDSNGCQKNAKVCIDETKEPILFDECFKPSVDTRLNNPPCNLRGTGWNRWEWLCKNPQANLEEPYDLRINSRLLSKDNHRPCIPKPIDQFLAHPEYNEEEVCEKITPLENTCAVPTSPPSVQWQSLNNIQRY
jgi:hypothetical protein